MTEYNPFAERQVKHPTTDFETIIHLCKGSMGSGILAMPAAFRSIGLWAGLPGTLLVGIICVYCIHMLVKAAQTLCVRCQVPVLNYAETAEQAFVNDPKEMKKTGLAMRYIVNFFLCLDLLGTVCIYFVLVAKSAEQILNLHAPNSGISLRLWILILGLPHIFLCLIRDLKYLVPFSLIANLLVFVGLIITFTFIFMGLPSTDKRPAVVSVETWPLFMGTSIFAMENIGVVLACENAMKTPLHFTGCPSVLVIAMTIVIALYTFLGFFGYLRYGDKTEANITLNIPTDNGWAESAKVMVALAVYLTVLLQFYVPINIMWNGIKERIAERWQLLTEYCVRIGVMIICVAVAIAFPNLGPFISLIGAVCLSTLGLMLPAIIDIIVFRIDPGWGWMKFHLIKDILLILFGILGFLTGTYVSVREFYMTFSLHEK